MNSFFWIIRFAKGSQAAIYISFILSGLCGVFVVAPYFVMYRLAAELSSGAFKTGEAGGYAAALLAIILVGALLRWLGGFLVHKAGFEVIYAIRSRLAEHLGRVPMSFFFSRNSGVLHKAMMEDAEKVESMFCHSLPDLVQSVVTPVFCLAVLFAVDWRLALFALAPFPLAVLFQGMMMRECRNKIDGYHNAMEQMNAGAQEYVNGMLTLRSFNLAPQYFTNFNDAIDNFRRVVLDWSDSSSRYYALFKTALGSGLLFVLVPGMFLFYSGGISMQNLVLFLMLVMGYALPVEKLLEFSSKLQEIKEGVSRLKKLIEVPELERPLAPRVPENFGIEFKEVVFSYAEKMDAPLFNGLSFRLEAGSLNAFVGPSGAGKSTAALLLARYQDVVSGSISIGGIDLRHINPEQLMEIVGVVFQDTFIFNDTILENIRAGRPGASDDEVYAAAARARADVFIRSFPEGYHTLAGEGGTPLSGGERQRIAIARVILRNTPIIIFDEAMAYSDPENETLIQESIQELIMGKTVIVIAHNLATISEADNIVVFADGRISGQGSHTALLETSQVYRRMWDEQQKAAHWSFVQAQGVAENRPLCGASNG